MATRLKGLRYRRIDLVDKGANAAALVTLCKRAGPDDDGGGMSDKSAKDPTVEELQKRLETMESDKAKAEADAKAAKDEAEAVTKAATDTETQLADLKKQADSDRATVAKMREDKARTEAVAINKSLAGLGSDEMADAIYQVREWNPDVAGVFESALTKAAAAQEMAVQIGALGSDGTDGISAGSDSGFQKLVKKHATEHKVNKVEATRAVLQTDEGRKLYTESKGE